MPTASRWMVRAALLWLVLGLVLRTLAPLHLGGVAGAWLAASAAAVLHLLTLGWLTQVVFGVGWWLLPRPPRNAGAVRRGLPWFAFVLLNAGVLLRLVAEPWAGFAPAALPRLLTTVAGAFTWLAVLAFVVEAWPRTRAAQ